MRLGRLVFENLVEPLRQAQGSPDSIARGAALGMFVAFTPTVGTQMLVVGMLGIPLRANIPVAIALVWISNPITLIPLYFAFYWLGTLVVREPPLTYESWSLLMGGAFDTAKGEGLWAGLLDLVEALGSEVVWPMAVGSFIMATALAVPTYHLVLLWAQRRRNRDHQEGEDGGAVQEPPALSSPPHSEEEVSP